MGGWLRAGRRVTQTDARHLKVTQEKTFLWSLAALIKTVEELGLRTYFLRFMSTDSAELYWDALEDGERYQLDGRVGLEVRGGVVGDHGRG